MSTTVKTVIIGVLSMGIFALGFRMGFTSEQEAARTQLH
jgi:hypothetical protein